MFSYSFQMFCINYTVTYEKVTLLHKIEETDYPQNDRVK